MYILLALGAVRGDRAGGGAVERGGEAAVAGGGSGGGYPYRFFESAISAKSPHSLFPLKSPRPLLKDVRDAS